MKCAKKVEILEENGLSSNKNRDYLELEKM